MAQVQFCFKEDISFGVVIKTTDKKSTVNTRV